MQTKTSLTITGVLLALSLIPGSSAFAATQTIVAAEIQDPKAEAPAGRRDNTRLIPARWERDGAERCRPFSSGHGKS